MVSALMKYVSYLLYISSGSILCICKGVIGVVTELQYLCSIAALHLEVPDSINLAIFVLQDLRRKSP